MAALTITDVDAVRAEGSLKDPSAAAGAATPAQIKLAIRDAKRRMKEKVTADVYATVLGWTAGDITADTTGAKADEKDAFVHAESCLAIAALTSTLNAQQLSDTGLIQSIEIGKARQSFAPSEEVKKISAGWEERANRWLSPYLAVPLDEITQKPTSFSSRKGSFYVGSL